MFGTLCRDYFNLILQYRNVFFESPSRSVVSDERQPARMMQVFLKHHIGLAPLLAGS
jgi:hypothetical protein